MNLNPRRAKIFQPAIARLLVVALIFPQLACCGLLAQTAGAVRAPMMLHINILEGEEALNNIKERTAREPIVQVEDENHKPVAGVVIVFTSVRGPNGAGGTFNSFTQYRTVTNAEGKAVGRGFQPNTTSGQFTIQVTATLGAMAAATAVIHETNTSGAAGESSSQPGSQSGTQGNGQTGTQGNGQAGAQGNTRPGSQGNGQAGTQTTSQTGGGATQVPTTTGATGAKGAIIHLFHIVPKWVVVGVAAGAAAAVTVAVTQGSTGTSISTGTGSVGAPTATKPTLGQ